ncbi:MAG: hypothetical protein IPJ49_24365 [Candidatus Obscuribacter sp.]|nr:hypothetical protein [Candidatus Obscuribacter sp.]
MAVFAFWSRRSHTLRGGQPQAALSEENKSAAGDRRSRAPFALLSLLALATCLNPFDCLSAAAKGPGKGEMILFKATGSMWGATSNRFSEHAFSLKSNRGVALWRDNDPGRVTLINPENKTYLIESIGEYLGDNHYGVEVPIAVEDSKVGPHAALDGHPCLETVFLVKPHAGRGGRRHRGLLAGKEAMLKSFDKSSTSPLKTSEVKSKSGTSGGTKVSSGQSKTKSKSELGKSASIAAPAGDRAANLIEIARVVSLKDITLPPSMLKAWATIMLTNSQSGFPVSLAVRPSYDWRDPDRKNEPVRALIEYQSLKFVPLEPKSFEIPAGFKKAQDKSAFYLSESGELKASDIDDFFRGELK